MYLNKLIKIFFITLLCFTLLPLENTSIDAQSQGALASLALDKQSGKVTLEITSPIGVYGAYVTITIPAEVQVGTPEATGFIGSAIYFHDVGSTNYEWGLFENKVKQTQGKVILPVNLSQGTTGKIILEDLTLQDDSNNSITVSTQLPIEIDLAGSEKSAMGTTGTTGTGNVSIITVETPNGGETIKSASAIKITWTVSDKKGTVTLYYSPDNGSTWKGIARRRPNTGSFNWKPPVGGIESCRIKVELTDSKGAIAEDSSNNSFKIEAPKTSTPAKKK